MGEEGWSNVEPRRWNREGGVGDLGVVVVVVVWEVVGVW